MSINYVDNLSYAKELYYTKKKVRKVGEHIIDKNVMNTIVGLVCLGRIPDFVIGSELNSENNTFKLITDNNQDPYFKFTMRYLLSFGIIKDSDYDFGDKYITIDNIDVLSIFRILSFGTMYNSIEETDAGFVLKYYPYSS